jgi:hypothetical protein
MAMNQPIGMTFIPSADNQAMGPRQAGLEGAGGSDLAQAFKVLSLHLPQFLGAQALAPKRLLTSPGSTALPSGFNPQAAVIQALLQAMGGGGGGGMSTPDPGRSDGRLFPDVAQSAPSFPTGPIGQPPVPRVNPGSQDPIRAAMPWDNVSAATPSAPLTGPFESRGRNRLA